ncbi:MAG TPA: RIP metalloprotease RseP [Acidobacteriaceae bacterium]|jgi:regulator of sigma E protease|nr:RIP metalloprotease RseP [Acidobacteriaceae bacterium]
MPFAVTATVSFLIVLGIMVLVHEFGHFAVAKLCGVRVEVFSLGFGTRLFGIKWGETDYRVSALPLGGYVKMSGETPGAEVTGDPGEFGSHPRWQRVLIAVAGPIANFLLAFVLMAGLYMMHNEVEQYLDAPAVLDIVPPNSPAGHAGLQAGDRITRFDSDKNPTWEKLTDRAALDVNSTVPVTVARTVNGQTQEFSTELLLTDASKGQDFTIESLGLLPKEQNGPVVVADVMPGYPAQKAGLKPGDAVVAVDGESVHSVSAVMAVLDQAGNKPATLLVERQGRSFSLTLQPIWTDFGNGEAPGYRLGFTPAPPPFTVEQLPLPEAVSHSISYNVRNIGYILDILRRMFRPHSAVMQQLRGPIGIAQMTGEAAEMHGWEPLIGLTALISLNLGIMNLLPFPILDGGMILLLAIEGLLRRDLKQEFKERIYQVAFVMIILLFAFIMVNDVSKLNLFSKLKP